MTYCVALNLNEGMVFASDTRTNAGMDQISTFNKMRVFTTDERLIVLLSSGNLATTQNALSQLEQRVRKNEEPHLLSVSSLYEATVLVGDTLKHVQLRDAENQMKGDIDFTASFIVGGQIKGEHQRLFSVYPQGNFIESSEETPYFQIGESKYGKPIIDRVLNYYSDMTTTLKCVLVSFDSTIRSNLSVGLPMDILTYKKNDLSSIKKKRIYRDDAYFNHISKAWSEGLQEAFNRLPNPDGW